MKLSKLNVAMLTLAGLLGVSSTGYGQWDPTQPVRNAGDRLKGAIDAEWQRLPESVNRATGMRYEVQVHNSTNNPIYYSFEGRPAALGGRKAVNWTGVGRPTISFDNGRNQTITYDLHSGKSYRFQWDRGVLNLFEQP